MRITLICLLFACLFCGGCAFARQNVMEQRAAQLPRIPGETGRESAAEGSLVMGIRNPWARINFDSPLPAKQTVEWYQDQLFKSGWKPRDNKPWEPHAMDPKSGRNTYSVVRTVYWRVGPVAIPYGDESLDVMVFSDGEHERMQLLFQATYVWDLPTAVGSGLITVPMVILFGEGALLADGFLRYF